MVLNMNKKDIYNFLDKMNIWYEVSEHEAVFNMEELSKLDLPYEGRDAKNLFVRDDKKKEYYLISVCGDKRVDLKEFKEKNNTRRLTFCSENDLFDKLGLTPGSVTPFGLLNDKDNLVKFYLDEDLVLSDEDIIGIHPNDNTATIWMKSSDLIDIIKDSGNEVKIIKI